MAVFLELTMSLVDIFLLLFAMNTKGSKYAMRIMKNKEAKKKKKKKK